MDSDAGLAAALIHALDEVDAAALAAALAGLRAAAATWPTLPPPDLAFVRSVADRLPAGSAAAAIAAVKLDELLLAYHGARGHVVALQVIRTLLDDLRAPLRRTGASPAQIDELLTDLPGDLLGPRTTGAARILGFSGRSTLAAWLRVVAVRMLVERRRRAGAVIDDDDVTLAQTATADLDPELELLRRTYAREFREAFAAAIAELAPEDRALLRQHHIDGVGLDALALLHGVHRATAARRLAAARETIFLKVRRRLLHDLKVGNATVDSILRIVQSDLDLSIERML